MISADEIALFDKRKEKTVTEKLIEKWRRFIKVQSLRFNQNKQSHGT